MLLRFYKDWAILPLIRGFIWLARESYDTHSSWATSYHPKFDGFFSYLAELDLKWYWKPQDEFKQLETVGRKNTLNPSRFVTADLYLLGTPHTRPEAQKWHLGGQICSFLLANNIQQQQKHCYFSTITSVILFFWASSIFGQLYFKTHLTNHLQRAPG